MVCMVEIETNLLIIVISRSPLNSLRWEVLRSSEVLVPLARIRQTLGSCLAWAQEIIHSQASLGQQQLQRQQQETELSTFIIV